MYPINVARTVALEPAAAPGDTFTLQLNADDTYFEVEGIASSVDAADLPAIDLIVVRQGKEAAPVALTGQRMVSVSVGTVPGRADGNISAYDGVGWVDTPQRVAGPTVAVRLKNNTASKVFVRLNLLGKAWRL